MNIEIRKTYSEVYSVLNMFGEEFISKLPNNLYILIEKSKLDEYNPEYSKELPLNEQNMKKETVAMLSLFYLTYWCESEEEKDSFKKILEENAEKNQEKENNENNQKELEEQEIEKNIFKTEEDKLKKQEKSIALEKNNVFRRIIIKIKSFLLGNKQSR